MKLPVRVGPTWVIYVEEIPECFFMHCSVFKWNKTTKKQIMEGLLDFEAEVDKPILALRDPATGIPSAKFLEMYGFRHQHDFIATDGKVRQLFKRIP